MYKLEDLRIGQIVYFENGDILEIVGLNKYSKFPVKLKGNKNGYDGDYTLDAFLVEKPKEKFKYEGICKIFHDIYGVQIYELKSSIVINDELDSKSIYKISIEEL